MSAVFLLTTCPFYVRIYISFNFWDIIAGISFKIIFVNKLFESRNPHLKVTLYAILFRLQAILIHSYPDYPTWHIACCILRFQFCSSSCSLSHALYANQLQIGAQHAAFSHRRMTRVFRWRFMQIFSIATIKGTTDAKIETKVFAVACNM